MKDKTTHTRESITTILDEPDEVMRRQVGGFVTFMREKAVVGLAVGFIVGQQAQGLIKQLVDSFISPWMNIIVGEKLQDKVTRFGGQDFAWGKFTYVFINFLLVLLAIYLLIKFFKLDKLDLPKEAKSKKKS